MTGTLAQRVRQWLRRCDTLFLRLFVLLWLALAGSHLVAFHLVGSSLAPPAGVPTVHPPGRPADPPTAPPTAPPAAWPPGPPPERPMLPPVLGALPPPLPTAALWWDYGLRALVLALAAALGAHWLSAPMRRLAHAAQALSDGLARGQAPPLLDDSQGTHEVRSTAAVFNRMAQRLREQFDARSRHMAALSHDLRTPLTRLRLRLEAAPAALAEAAAADIHAMNEMVDGTLAVLREQRDGAAPDLLDLQALLQALVDDRAVAGEVVTLDAPAGSVAPRAAARPAALRRVLDNLVDNALRHGGSAHLGLQLGQGHVLLTVDDRGPGLPEAALEQVFQPWLRLPATSPADDRSGPAGHGLGLAIARDLAARDGGLLSLHNRPGGGLRAQLQLPTTVSAPTHAA